MTTLRFKQVDVFTAVPFQGNPLAVVFGADDLSGSEMQRIACWTNLSETTFVLVSEKADFGSRIFSPTTELPWAGHPTVGTGHAVRELGLLPADKDHVTMECQAGLIPLIIDGEEFLAEVPSPRIVPTRPDLNRLRTALGNDSAVDPLLVDVGPLWMATMVDSLDSLYGIRPDNASLSELSQSLSSVGVSVYAIDKNELHVRSFAPAVGVIEDPVCGSGNAAVAVHAKTTGLDTLVGRSYTAIQGHALGRDGRVRVKIEDDRLFIGGRSTTVVDGEIRI